MKKAIIGIVKILVATIVAIVVTMIIDAIGIGYWYGHVAVFFCTGIGMVALLGVFSDEESAKHESIKHYNGRRNYGQAAVFIGTAAIFVGTPQQCEDMADDLQHYAQQAKVKMLTGEETEFEIL